jgi:hypothetical protein
MSFRLGWLFSRYNDVKIVVESLQVDPKEGVNLSLPRNANLSQGEGEGKGKALPDVDQSLAPSKNMSNLCRLQRC